MKISIITLTVLQTLEDTSSNLPNTKKRSAYLKPIFYRKFESKSTRSVSILVFLFKLFFSSQNIFSYISALIS